MFYERIWFFLPPGGLLYPHSSIGLVENGIGATSVSVDNTDCGNNIDFTKRKYSIESHDILW